MSINVYKRDNFTCQYCGFDGKDFLSWKQLTIDHVKPTTKGGTDDESNLVVCCSHCNTVKKNTDFDSFEEAKAYMEKKNAELLKDYNKIRGHWGQA